MRFNIPFMKYRKVAAALSMSIFLISIISLSLRGLSLGLDFSGGTQVVVSYADKADLSSIRNLLDSKGFEDFQVITFGSDTEVQIKIATDEGQESNSSESNNGTRVFAALAENNTNLELKSIDVVGAQIGDELRDEGGFGMLIALGMILLYVAFRFQYKFALGAVIALAHDVVFILGIFSLLAWDFDLTVLAALLAVIGYSLNDTIVVSDRIRENFRQERGLQSEEVVDLSINQMLSRTLITSFTTLLVLFALFFLGGEVIRGFSSALIIGVIVGTYSSIYVVANMLIVFGIDQEDMALPEPEGAEFDDMP